MLIKCNFLKIYKKYYSLKPILLKPILYNFASPVILSWFNYINYIYSKTTQKLFIIIQINNIINTFIFYMKSIV